MTPGKWRNSIQFKKTLFLSINTVTIVFTSKGRLFLILYKDDIYELLPNIFIHRETISVQTTGILQKYNSIPLICKRDVK